jgi:hypothetical protein
MYLYKTASAFIVIICLFNTSCSVNKKRALLQNDSAVKEVKAVIEEFPNYIFHLLTLGGIVPEYPEYIYLYKDSVLTDDQQYLYANRNLLAWGDGNSGPLTQLFLFLPGYINLQSQSDINEYFDLLNNSLKNETFNEFIQKYDSYFKDLALWGGPTDIASYLQSFIQYTDEILRIGEIYKNNFQAYHVNVWPIEKEKLGKAAATMNNGLKRLDLINRWEMVTGSKFKFDEYQIVLYSANKNGPNANSFGYNRNAFYYLPDDIDITIQFISHETGTHILIDSLSYVIQMNRFEYLDVYMAYEHLAEFYNIEYVFTEKQTVNIVNYDTKYHQIYTDTYNSNDNICPTDLLTKGLEINYAQRN